MSNLTIRPLFVYGSLRSGFQSPAYEYISQYFYLKSAAKVKGKLFDLGEYPAAIPTEEESFIIGELFYIKSEDEFDWAIAQLDDYEGVITEVGEPQLYRRELTTVYAGDETVEAWVYWYNGDVSGKPFIASGDVLEYIKNKQGGGI